MGDTESRKKRELALLLCIAILSVPFGLWAGYQRYFAGTSADLRQAVAPERIADSLERISR